MQEWPVCGSFSLYGFDRPAPFAAGCGLCALGGEFLSIVTLNFSCQGAVRFGGVYFFCIDKRDKTLFNSLFVLTKREIKQLPVLFG